MLLREDLKLVVDPDGPPKYILPKAVVLEGNVVVPMRSIWFLATGWAKLNHWLRYDSAEEKLSFRDGEHVWKLTDVQCLLVLTAEIGWFNTPVTEFQILVGQQRPFAGISSLARRFPIPFELSETWSNPTRINEEDRLFCEA